MEPVPNRAKDTRRQVVDFYNSIPGDQNDYSHSANIRFVGNRWTKAHRGDIAKYREGTNAWTVPGDLNVYSPIKEEDRKYRN